MTSAETVVEAEMVFMAAFRHSEVQACCRISASS